MRIKQLINLVMLVALSGLIWITAMSCSSSTGGLLRVKAEAGDAEAQYKLGLRYYHGHGVPEDYAQAVSWYRKAAQQGYALAQYNLGVMYANGRGVPEDDAQAVSWYRKAAQQGDASAQANLGNMYYRGEGVRKSLVDAYMWVNLAAAQGNKLAQPKNAIDAKASISSLMTSAQRSQAQRLSRECRAKNYRRCGLSAYRAGPNAFSAISRARN